MLNNDIKFMLNELQLHISNDTDKELLIFDTKHQLDNFKREYQNDLEMMYDLILITLGEIVYEHKLTGLRFRRYEFKIGE